MNVVSDFDDTGALIDLFVGAQARATSLTMQEVRDGVVSDWRTMIQQAGLGTRLGNTIRGKVYPSQPSMDASAYIWTKAPKLIGAYAFGAMIVPTNGRKYIAIPTKNVPVRRGGRPMLPREVEQYFGQKLRFVFHGSEVLAFIDAVRSNNGKGFRRATAGRLAKGRDLREVLMFVLVTGVKVGKRLDLDALVAKWSDRVPDLIDKNWSN